jgi:alcohol dehydrogenase class IV
MWWFISPNLIFGEDALEYLKDIECTKVFIVTDSTMQKIGVVDRIISYLGTDKKIEIYADVEPEPSLDTVKNGAKQMADFSPDLIIALGGGSCLDAAKAMWVLYEKPELGIDDIHPFTKLGLREKAKLVAIPTTSGTGAEATWAIVLTDVMQKKKIALASKEVIADYAIIDATVAKSMPPSLTADTGLDALTHAVEAYTSTWKTDFTDAFAIKAIQLVFEYLPVAYKNGDDMTARIKMHNAATMAGLAFGNSQVGIAHSMGHSFGALFKIPHGRAVGLFLPYVIQFNSKMDNISKYYGEIARSINAGDDSKDLVNAIKTLMYAVKEPTSISAIGITKDEFDAMLDALVLNADSDTCTVTNPRIPTQTDFRNLFKYAYDGNDIDF